MRADDAAADITDRMCLGTVYGESRWGFGSSYKVRESDAMAEKKWESMIDSGRSAGCVRISIVGSAICCPSNLFQPALRAPSQELGRGAVKDGELLAGESEQGHIPAQQAESVSKEVAEV